MTQDILVRNNVKVTGTGDQPIVFAHGFGCDQTMWRYVAPCFEATHKVVLFDYVGWGHSDIGAFDEARYSTLDGYAQDLLDVIEALDLRDITFVGHSVSSMIGALASLKAPDRFGQLVMIGPSPCYINDPPDYYGGFEREEIEGLLDLMDKNLSGWASFLAPVIMKNTERPELAAELEQSFCSTSRVIANCFAEATFLSDNRADLAKITVPTLVMQCADDSIAPTQVGEYVHQQIQHSKLVMMRATGHCPHMSHPAETADLIKTYLAELTAPASR